MIKKFKDTITIGFALFAIFFGAGNLIFPPYLGVISSSNYIKAMIGFLLTDPLLPVLGVFVTAKLSDNKKNLGHRVSKNFAKILSTISILIIGPFFCIPRTAATTYEIAVSKIFPNVNIVLSSIIFFIFTIFFAINKNKVISYIGNFLTPILLIILSIIIIKCIIHPIAPIKEITDEKFFIKGFTEGYQTMDALGASLISAVVIEEIIMRGYKKEKEKILIGVCVVCFILLVFVYGGLTYVGANVSSFFTKDSKRTIIFLTIVNKLFGDFGKFIISIAVTLACITTSVGLTKAFGNYFETISNEKLKYKTMVVFSSIISLIISFIGVEKIINLAIPILSLIYPIVILLILMSLFDKYIKYDESYKVAVCITFIISLFKMLNFFNFNNCILKKFFLVEYGLEWLIPSIICILFFNFFKKIKLKRKV